MNPYLAGKKAPAMPAMPRIDLLLTLYDGALERINTALKWVRSDNRAAAAPVLARTQLLVSELAAGVRIDIDPEMGTNYLRLYEFVTHLLKVGGERELVDAVRILTTLREGFAGIREEAVAMERRGEFASSDKLLTLCATA